MKCKTCKNKSIQFGYCLPCWESLSLKTRIEVIDKLLATNTTKTKTKRSDGDLLAPGAFTAILSMGVCAVVLMFNSWVVGVCATAGLIGVCLAYSKYYEGGK